MIQTAKEFQEFSFVPCCTDCEFSRDQKKNFSKVCRLGDFEIYLPRFRICDYHVTKK